MKRGGGHKQREREREREREKGKLTAIVNLVRKRLDGALLRLLDRLRLELAADVAGAAGVDGLLQGVALPTEDVVAVLGVAVAVVVIGVSYLYYP